MLDGADTETPFGEPIYLKPNEPIYIRGMETGSKGDAKQVALDELTEASSGEDTSWGSFRKAINKLAFEALVQNYGKEKAQDIADQIPTNFASEIISILTVGSGQPNFTGGGSPQGSLPDLRKNVSVAASDGV